MTLSERKEQCQPDVPLYFPSSATVPLFDAWIETYQKEQKRFAFTEEEVLTYFWQELGEDIRLREDERFKQMPHIMHRSTDLWYIAHHKIANELLYDLLVDQEWDGADLFRRLELLDQEYGEGTYHIYCQRDDRFALSEVENGYLRLTLTDASTISAVPPEQQHVIFNCFTLLLNDQTEFFTIPHTAVELLESLQHTLPNDDLLQSVSLSHLKAWLRQQPNWIRVGPDFWLMEHFLPSLPSKHRYAVNSVKAHLSDSTSFDKVSLSYHDTTAIDNYRENAQEIEHDSSPGSVASENTCVKWRIVLRTIHLNEGTVSIPLSARVFYPQEKKLADTIVIKGLWFVDGDNILVWLDRNENRFFGPDLETKFAYLEPGTILEIIWGTYGLNLRTVGIDTQVEEEEARLVDLSEIGRLRSTLLESYRESLRAIFIDKQISLPFSEVYEELCRRQGHSAHSGTIRSILSSSPEFMFIKPKKEWALNIDVQSELGAKILRRSVAIARQIEAHPKDSSLEAIPLKKIIESNRQKISDLRSIYHLQ